MKLKHLLFLIAVFGYTLTQAQCNINTSNVNQSPILCNGGSANLSLLVNGGTAPYTYTFGTIATNTIVPDSMVWGQTIIDFSSEYGGSWSAVDILNAPDIYPSYGDIGGSWTTETDTMREYIVIGYPATLASKVLVYETYEPGSCDTVYVRAAATGIWHTIYTGTAALDAPGAVIKSYAIPGTIGAIDAVRLAVDGSIATYYEVDAVGLVNTSLVYPINMSGINAGTYTLIIEDNAACTYTASFNYTEPAVITHTQNITICSNQQVVVGGNMYNTPGNYTDILTSVNGCDSTVYTNLTVNSGNATYFSIDTVLCFGQTLTVGSIIHNVSGFYSDTLSNAEGCDSIVNVTLKIYSSNIPMVMVKELPNNNIASGGTASADSYYGSNYAADAFDGDFDITGWGNNGNGFPSWLEYNYGVGNSKVVKGYSFYCSSNMNGGWGTPNYDPKAWNFQGFNGTAWVNLDTVVDNNPTQDVWNTYTINNNTAFQKYRMYITSSDDGDYVMITELKLLTTDSCANKLFIAVPNDVAKDTIQSYQWMVNGNMVGTNSDSLNLSTFALGDVVECMVVTNNACATSTMATGSYTINTGAAVATASVNGVVITAYPAGLSYRWIDCSTNTEILNETSQTFTAQSNGNYAAIVTSGSCSIDTTTCIQILSVGVKTNNANDVVKLYPNPNNGSFVIDAANQSAEVQVVDVLGNLVYSTTIKNGKETVIIPNAANGVYFVKVNTNHTQTTHRMVINH